MTNKYRFSANRLIKSYLFSIAYDQGLSLLELLVVLFFMGILAAVAIPTFLSQIGKGREAETLILMGTIARSQQAFHYLNGNFANFAQLQADTGVIKSKYHDFNNFTIASSKVKIQAISLDSGGDQVRNYATGIYFENGGYQRVTCQGELVGTDVQVGDTPNDPCTNNGTKI